MKLFQQKAVNSAIARGAGLERELYNHKLSPERVDLVLGKEEGFCQGELDKQSGKKKKVKAKPAVKKLGPANAGTESK